jgi:glycosyltransferase involved in cell wall biosynthesis/SAM-dependent methyltransferase
MDIVTPSPEEALEFTGERYTSATSGEIKHEHYHRYFFSLQFCRQKIVLDIASGEGYGSALLGTVAQQVFGVDIAPDAANHALRNYGSARVSFTVGDCIAIPLQDASVDVVVSFETLEHVADQKKFFSEIKRVLRPDGMLVISTPNVEVYKEVATKPNPFHVKELDVDEFHAILSEHFSNYRLLGQRSVVGSAIAPDSLSAADRQQTFKATDSSVYSVEPGIGPPTYLIAVASDTALSEIQHGLLDDRPFLMNLYNRLQKREIEILQIEHQLRVAATTRDQLEHHLQNRETELNGRANQMAAELRSRNDELALAKAELIELHGRANQMAAELRSRNDELALLRVAKSELIELHGRANQMAAELRSRNDELAQLRVAKSELIELHGRANQMLVELQSRDDELAQLRTLVARIYRSGSWRLTRPMRFFRDMVCALKDRTVLLARGFRPNRLSGYLALGNRANPGVADEHSPTQSGSTARPDGAPASGLSAEPESELQLLARSGLFDEQFYGESNPDLAAAGISLLEHFLKVGAVEGRRPNPLFDTAYYLTNNPDVAKAGVNPVLHYFLQGAQEGRDPSPDFDTSFYLGSNPDVAASGVNPLVHFLGFGAQEGRLPLPPESSAHDLRKLARIAAVRHRQEKLEYRPLLSVLMPTYNTQPIYLEAAVRSVVAQAYPNWELRIVDDGSSNAATLDSLERIESWDNRIFVVRNAQHQGISGATNEALRDACGEYVAMLDHDDELTVDALFEVVLALNGDRAIDVVYTDQDYVSPHGESVGHLFKPDWSPTLFRGVMYVGHLLTVRRSVALEIGGFDSAFDLVQDFEFMLRLSEQTRKIYHVPKVLYHWRRIPESVAGGGKADGSIERLQTAAVQAHLGRLRLDGHARPNLRHPHRVFIEPGKLPRDTDFDLFVHGREVSTASVMTVENALARMADRLRRVAVPPSWSGVKFDNKVTADLSFNGAEQSFSDAGTLSRFLAESSAEFVVAMSTEIVIETEDWLESVVSAAQERDVVVACPAVLSIDGSIAHAGFIIGGNGGVRPAMRGLDPESDGYAGSLSCAREISAAWADLVLLRRSPLVPLLPPHLGYFTADFLVADLTLQATRSGLRAVCVPYVRARRPATTEADEDHLLDALLFEDIWTSKAVRDPFYNPNFADMRSDYIPKEFSLEARG